MLITPFIFACCSSQYIPHLPQAWYIMVLSHCTMGLLQNMIHGQSLYMLTRTLHTLAYIIFYGIVLNGLWER